MDWHNVLSCSSILAQARDLRRKKNYHCHSVSKLMNIFKVCLTRVATGHLNWYNQCMTEHLENVWKLSSVLSYALGWTLKSLKKEQKKSNNSESVWKQTLMCVSPACRFLWWNHIRGRLGKITKLMLQNDFFGSIRSINFVLFPHTSTNVIALRKSSYMWDTHTCLLPKTKKWMIFPYFYDFTFHMSSSQQEDFRIQMPYQTTSEKQNPKNTEHAP